MKYVLLTPSLITYCKLKTFTLFSKNLRRFEHNFD